MLSISLSLSLSEAQIHIYLFTITNIMLIFVIEQTKNKINYHKNEKCFFILFTWKLVSSMGVQIKLDTK